MAPDDLRCRSTYILPRLFFLRRRTPDGDTSIAKHIEMSAATFMRSCSKIAQYILKYSRQTHAFHKAIS
jgi:hypothetical protein